jgi:hypothetical protein
MRFASTFRSAAPPCSRRLISGGYEFRHHFLLLPGKRGFGAWFDFGITDAVRE